ncbi:hypothetical protein [Streptomyces sp. NPDC086989]|uniref:hypothetical protein n=1 Tax=Streptomyces sp. NPDC086989 TaxID=3365764 RepID=UPI003825BE10
MPVPASTSSEEGKKEGGRRNDHAPQRSMAAELDEGLTDGSAKKWVRERGGQVEYTAASRRHLPSNLYGIREDGKKVDPFGQIVYTPNTTPGRKLLYLGG